MNGNCLKLQIFEKEIANLINRLSLENESNTPDFVLAKYLTNCLINFNKTSKLKDNFHNSEPTNTLTVVQQND
jgi:hypothetical protein